MSIFSLIEMRFDLSKKFLIGQCPTCGHSLRLERKGDGFFNNLVPCMKCKETFKISVSEVENVSTYDRKTIRAFGIVYEIKSNFDDESYGLLIECLFDNVGKMTYISDGFTCVPGEEKENCPIITFNKIQKTIRFGLTGTFLEREAVKIIDQFANKIAEARKLDLNQILIEIWENKEKGFELVEQRPLKSSVVPSIFIIQPKKIRVN